ncbi:preprotein translocase subunit SecE [Corynebacterium halotolerans]|uniref:Protein translocase subunit SecE n=1 Tax=Corynebacterium halotolerans YIM 70093 = DSM 44683 TaxID=1121362 RepID=M1NPS5_9CORY|nr:preprotein translocase subunit SecE [Corynebacterium halotolerans]AGF71482.1 preprotein translocase subunit SecE [Corynebacterium halotolerans YIM 70093 = DSM 44683]
MSEDQPNQSGGARPTGKRQLAGVSTTSTASYEAKKVTRPTPGDEKPGGGPVAFVPEVVSEMRKVIWPTARQMVTYTVVVFAFLIIVTALVSGVDFVVGLGVEKVLTP